MESCRLYPYMPDSDEPPTHELRLMSQLILLQSSTMFNKIVVVKTVINTSSDLFLEKHTMLHSMN